MPTSSSVRYSNTSISVTPTGPSTTPYTTSTVYSTRTSTISECAKTVTNCPYRTHPVTTEIVEVYTTVCPVTAAETSSGVVSSKSPWSPPPPPESVTSTIYTTKVYTIMSCAPTVTNCPAKLGQVTTEIVSYTTVCAYTAKGTHPAYPHTRSVAPPAAVSSPAGVVSAPASVPTVVIIQTETVKPLSSLPIYSTVSPISNTTIPAGAAGTSSAGGVVAPSQSPIYSSGAGERTAKGALAIFMAGVILLV